MSQTIRVTRRIEYMRGGDNQNAASPPDLRQVINRSGGALARGDVVIRDHTNSTPDVLAVTTTTTAFHRDVVGVVHDLAIADGAVGFVIERGPFTFLKVDGTTDIAAGDLLGTFTTAKIAQKTTGPGAFAYAQEAYSTNDSSGVIDCWIDVGALKSSAFSSGGSLLPAANDAGALGASGTAWADLFLASGGVINWNAGNYTITHSAGLLTTNGALTIAGALAGVTTLSMAGALTGVTTIATSGAINSQTISATAAFTGTVSVATGLTVTAGGARIDGNVRIGAAVATNIGYGATGNLTASGGGAFGTNFAMTLVAAANSDDLYGIRTVPTFTPGAFTGLKTYGLKIADFSTAAFTSPADPKGIDIGVVTGTGAAVAYGLYVNAPIGATSNMPIHVTSGLVGVGDTAHANISTGLVLNQGAADNLILALKSSDVATGLTNIVVGADVETDDYYTIQKAAGATGGAHVQVMAATGLATPFFQDSWGGAPATTDTSASLAAQNFFVGQHDGLNADADMAADSNAFAWGEIDSNNARLTRMLLKADDGELHLGNATLVALDTEDDVMLVRALQRETAHGRGIVPSLYDPANPLQDYERLRELGLVGEKDASGFHLFPLQRRLALYEGAIWQTYTRLQDALKEIAGLKAHLALGGM